MKEERRKKKDVKIFSSIKTKIGFMVLAFVVCTFFITEFNILVPSRANLTELNQNYLFDMAKQTGLLLDEEIENLGYEAAIQYDELTKIFSGIGLKGVDSSYAYVVSADGTMMYHPTESKVGAPVENEVIAKVVAELQAGNKPDTEVVNYLYEGLSKYAAYYITDDSQAIVVVTADEDEIMDGQTQLILRATNGGILMLVVALVVMYIACSIMINPIKKTTEIIKQTSELDFTNSEKLQVLAKRKDETGVMAKAVDNMRNKIGEVVLSMQEQSKVLTESADNLSKAAVETADTIEQVEKAVSEIADGASSQADETQKATENVILMGNMVEETNAGVTTLSDTATVMKESGEKATTTLGELEEINQKARESINIIYEQTNTTNESANKIREVTEIITDIAEETNLLSLNASIEAARAGEAGRGFAVVASQISQLAEQSNDSARQIVSIVESLIGDSEKAVKTMEEVKDIIKVQSEKVEQTANMFGQVKDGIDTSIGEIKTISEKTKRLDEARITVVDVVQNLAAIAEENAASTEETSASVTEVSTFVFNISENSSRLNGVSANLDESINKFTL